MISLPRLLATSLALGLATACVTGDPPVPPTAWSGTRTYLEDSDPPSRRADLIFDGRGNVTGTIDHLGGGVPGTFVKGTATSTSLIVTEQTLSNGQLLTTQNTYPLSPDGDTLTINGTRFLQRPTP